MKSRISTNIAAIALLVTLVFPVSLAARNLERHLQFHHYKVTEFDTLGGTFSQAFGISDQGWVNGGSTLAGDSAIHAFFRRSGIFRHSVCITKRG